MSYICPKCKGKNVEGVYWVNHNTLLVNNTYQAEDRSWCCDCEEFVIVIDDELESENIKDEST